MPMFFEIVALLAGVLGAAIGAIVGFFIGVQYDFFRQRILRGAIGGAIGGVLLFWVASIVTYTLVPQETVHTEWGTRSLPKSPRMCS